MGLRRTLVKPDLVKLLDAVANLNVIIIGEAMLDGYLEGFSDRLCPEASAPVVTVKNRLYVPGGAANTAVNISSLGSRVTFLSVIGDDWEGSQLQQALLERGISTQHILKVSNRQTLTKQRVISASQIQVRFDSGTTDAIDTQTEQALIDEIELLFPESDAVIISDYGYGILTQRVIHAIAQLQQTSPRVLVVDSKNLTAYCHLGVTAVKPNYEQAVQLLTLFPASEASERGSRAEQIKAYGEKLLHLTGAKIAAVTLDAEGAIIFERDSPPHRTYAQPTTQSRTAGAGDTFTSAFTLALASGATTSLAADFAAAAAAVVVRQDGTTACSAEELREFLSQVGGEINSKFKIQNSKLGVSSSSASSPSSLPNKYIDINQLCLLVASYRNAGQKIVFTNGCFDILHAGHVCYLNHAKTLGDILVIGVNSDESIRRLKGRTRPINSLEDRIQVLGALSCVDHLVAFDKDNPCHLIRLVQPDVYVKGGDYTKETLPEAPLVQEYGGVVELLPLLENRSTTRIIERITKEWSGGSS
ncbi:bifunctional heptose 7-phosphate kinase/heptose 1-phosphate adenyltransferase [Nostocales cyanobacterium HT-58-2]|nr:bifunctional heptose 7-phosphate kinase/heptose 1-phosphate adenyltransferase [Nostocales cyanobacterium HT-58-2]